jgi:hypothetical protein
MRSQNSHSPNSDLNERLWLARASEEGILDNLPCPDCHNDSVSVRFTHPAANEYRTWYVCKCCSFKMRTHDTERPPYYHNDRVDEQLQAYDSDLLKKMLFKK